MLNKWLDAFIQFRAKDPNFWTIIGIAHVVIIAPLLLMLAIYRKSAPNWLFVVAGILALWTIIYHLMTLYSQNYKLWIVLMHLVIIVPILLYIWYNGANSTLESFEIIKWIAILAIIYHGYYLILPFFT